MPGTTKDTTEVVTAALRQRPEATVVELAETAGVGRSTAAKCLAALEAAGTARRVPGGRDGGRRVADRWVPAKPRPPAGQPTADGDVGGGSDSDRPVAGGTIEDGGVRAPRLAKGELAALVLDYLSAHPEELGPTAVGKALGRSQGAVANALRRLQVDGRVRLVSEAPRMYRLADD
ncbi:MAG: MarR family transcriptional regulator [Acidimicrobiales bacterium]